MLPIPATSSTICIGSRYWRTNARQRGSDAASANLFGPYFARRLSTSAAVRPAAGSTPNAAATSAPGREYQASAGASAVWGATLTGDIVSCAAGPPKRPTGA